MYYLALPRTRNMGLMMSCFGGVVGFLCCEKKVQNLLFLLLPKSVQEVFFFLAGCCCCWLLLNYVYSKEVRSELTWICFPPLIYIF